MKKNTSSKNSATKSTKSPAKSKSVTTKLDEFDLQKNLLKRKKTILLGDVVEKYVNASEVKYFDYPAYQELYEQVDWLPKVHLYEKVNETVTKITIEWVDGVLLDDLYNDKSISTPSDMKSLHYYEVLNMYIEMQKFSRKKSGGNNEIFFHTGITPSNIIKTPDERLVLIDPDEFQLGDKTNFITNIMTKYARWLFKMLEE